MRLPLEEEADNVKAFEDIQRVNHPREIPKHKRLDGFIALIVAQTCIYFKTLDGTHLGIQRWLTAHF